VACEPNCGRYMPAFITIPHIRRIKHFHDYQTKSRYNSFPSGKAVGCLHHLRINQHFYKMLCDLI
jgi:hypothetical protein